MQPTVIEFDPHTLWALASIGAAIVVALFGACLGLK